jgi:hypothetical protein
MQHWGNIILIMARLTLEAVQLIIVLLVPGVTILQLPGRVLKVCARTLPTRLAH